MNYKTFPERDMTKTAEQQGIFRKFEVSRVDGSDQAGGKHHGCRYFVLDLDHDQHAPAAMRAYAVACASTHPDLSADIEREFGAEASADKGAVPNPHDAAEQADIGKRIRRVAKLAGYVPDGSDEFYYAAAFAILGRAADALETRAAMPGKVAEGWKLVPVEPTPEMVNTLADAISSMSATDAYKETIKAATINPVQGEPVLIAYAATDLDGHVGVGLTIADAQARAGHGCDTIIPLYDIATPGNETAFAAAPAVQGQDGELPPDWDGEGMPPIGAHVHYSCEFGSGIGVVEGCGHEHTEMSEDSLEIRDVLTGNGYILLSSDCKPVNKKAAIEPVGKLTIVEGGNYIMTRKRNETDRALKAGEYDLFLCAATPSPAVPPSDAPAKGYDYQVRNIKISSTHPIPQEAIDAAESVLVAQEFPSDYRNDDPAEAAFWRFDARKKGRNHWKGAPQSERDAFKAEYRVLDAWWSERLAKAQKVRELSDDDILQLFANATSNERDNAKTVECYPEEAIAFGRAIIAAIAASQQEGKDMLNANQA